MKKKACTDTWKMLPTGVGEVYLTLRMKIKH